jgi:sensor domain DACNV-containing protein
MTGPAYPAAHKVAPKVYAHFERHIADAHARGLDGVATVPDAGTIEAMIDAAFWASLRREEIYVPKISLAFLSPQQTGHPLMFRRPLALEPTALVRLAPAVERAGIHLGVWRDDNGGLSVWGTTRPIPPLCIVIEVAAPGLLVIKHHRGEEAGKYVNVAVLEGDQIKVVDEQASSLPDCPSLLTSLLGFDSPASWVDSVNLMVQLAVSMRTHGRGGSLLVVPAGSDEWLESMVRPMPYAVVPAFTELAQLRRETPDDRRRRLWQETVSRSVEAIAGLTAVDGATVLTTDYDLLAFGAKIARRKGSPQVEQVTMTEPIEGGAPALVHPTQLGGTRHLSAAQFVHDQRDAIALVASQDGRFTVFAWSPCEDMVHAHRVETLLL